MTDDVVGWFLEDICLGLLYLNAPQLAGDAELETKLGRRHCSDTELVPFLPKAGPNLKNAICFN
jgi:hypothetical protein